MADFTMPSLGADMEEGTLLEWLVKPGDWVKRGDIVAVVSCGGRPDLTGVRRLAQVQAPTLLIVGGADDAVLDLNRIARAAMRTTVELTVVPNATHRLEEPGALERAAALAGDWFVRWLDGSASLSRTASG